MFNLYCPHCGAENLDNAIYCQNCGKKINEPGKEHLKKFINFLIIIVLIFVILIVLGNIVKQEAIQDAKDINATATANYLSGTIIPLSNNEITPSLQNSLNNQITIKTSRHVYNS